MSTLNYDVLSMRELSEPLTDCWNRLVLERDTPNAFLSADFARACDEHVSEVRVLVLTDRSEPVGFFPFQFSDSVDRRLRAAIRPAGELSDCAGPVLRPPLKVQPDALLRMAGLNSWWFSHLPEQDAEVGSFRLRRRPGVRIRIPADGGYWAQLRQRDRKFANDTERREKRLIAAHGPLRFEFEAADPKAALEWILEMKTAQYLRTGVRDPFSEVPAYRQLLRGLADRTGAACRGVVNMLYVGDHLISAHFGLQSGSTLHFWFPVYDHRFSEFSPGRLLLKQVISAAPTRAIHCIDRGEGVTQSKIEFANEEQGFLDGVWYRPSLSWTASHTKRAIGWRIEVLRYLHRQWKLGQLTLRRVGKS